MVNQREQLKQLEVVMESQADLIRQIKAALNTEEEGAALVEVARNACRAEQELASLQRRGTLSSWSE